jgi:WhiB family redox-sensing transcriptional regulator
MEWVHRALCKDEDPELFFPVGNSGPAASQIDAAKAVCVRCDVRLECLEWAMRTAQGSGVWGGLSEEERRALRRARKRGSLRPVAAYVG